MSTYRAIVDENGYKGFSCMRCGALHHRRDMAEMHAQGHTMKDERDVKDDPEYRPLRKPSPEPEVRRRRRLPGALR